MPKQSEKLSRKSGHISLESGVASVLLTGYCRLLAVIVSSKYGITEMRIWYLQCLAACCLACCVLQADLAFHRLATDSWLNSLLLAVLPSVYCHPTTR